MTAFAARRTGAFPARVARRVELLERPLDLERHATQMQRLAHPKAGPDRPRVEWSMRSMIVTHSPMRLGFMTVSQTVWMGAAMSMLAITTDTGGRT